MTKLFALFVLVLSLGGCSKDKFSARNPEELYRFAAPSIVKIVIPGMGVGSGFYVNDLSGRLVVVSNAHVCMSRGQTLKIIPSDGSKGFISHPSTVSFREDLCVINAPLGDKHPGLAVAQHGALFGSTVFVAGHPKGLPFSVTSGLAIGRSIIGVAYPESFCRYGGTLIFDIMTGPMCGKKMDAITLTSSVFPGNSGGPLLNSSGEVIGVVFASGEVGGSALPLEKLQLILRVNAAK